MTHTLFGSLKRALVPCHNAFATTGFVPRAMRVTVSAAFAIGVAGCGTINAPRGEAVAGVASIAKQGVLFVGGKYKNGPAQGMTDQAYVFYQIPQGYQPGRDGKWPIIMVHGSEQTGANYLGTPDGRPGWAWYFASKGWPVYVIDQPGRGKSGYFPEAYGAQAKSPQSARVQSLFAGPELTQPLTWPEASLHTQWPGGRGSGKPGNEAFDQFMASQVANMPEYKQALSLTTEAIGQLLKKIGPAILITHSMTGPISWMVPQANPGKIKAVIAVEPTGNSSLRGDSAPGSPCGLTDECLTFLPAVQGAVNLGLTKVASPIPGLQSCWLQKEPARMLPNLGIPILISTGEASYHAQYDHCTSAFLKQAGVQNTWINLASVGIKGNGHMQMIELNSFEIADFYERWLLRTAR
ncbi:alpha/beta hydrolase [Polaromonas sp. SM01]|uniref:alpha/beta hydrolase n=1 Tax=Polaromonas sp. SM01 TaxID=3085630 RepID=UPI00298129CE|nr:alpha/beta hydrolase [Polaromonas sp. SM01]MDW5442357.1 alpha/beta hydrolase [Polaromonas sp. SM01]